MTLMNSRKIYSRLLLILALWLPALTSEAHRITLFAYVADNQVYAESYFSNGQPVNGALIMVSDITGQILLEGKTDAAGQFLFPLPQKEKAVKIQLNGSMGHHAEFLLPLKEEE